MRILVIFFASMSLIGCVQFPAVEDATSQVARDADYPDLIPLDPLADVLNGPGPEPIETTEQLDDRVTGLKSRAEDLKRPILDQNARARLAETPQ